MQFITRVDVHMKKKVKILKNNNISNSSTFLTDDMRDGSFTFQTPPTNSDANRIDPSKEDKLENKHKKKKVMNKKDGFNRGLKYSTPSQRNHSSVYE